MGLLLMEKAQRTHSISANHNYKGAKLTFSWSKYGIVKLYSLEIKNMK